MTSTTSAFKVETHNHPSAIEPYGGANTGLGGVIRDHARHRLGAKPICNTDVFCFAPPDYPCRRRYRPACCIRRRVMHGVVDGVHDYGNRMGIPTVNGAICFDERYLGNPLVYCGNVGLIPHDKSFKETQAGRLHRRASAGGPAATAFTARRSARRTDDRKRIALGRRRASLGAVRILSCFPINL
ncbi:MAG: AIR synthase related protein, partial [Pirellulales bacterium]